MAGSIPKEFIRDMFELNIPEEISNLILRAEKDDNLKEKFEKEEYPK